MRDIPFCLPEYLAIPTRVAAIFHSIGDNLSARDLAYSIAAVWLAANTDCKNEDGGMWRIPDNGLRHTMGLTRRESIDVDDGRMARLKAATFNWWAAPYSPWRHNLDDKRSWIIQEDLVEWWKIIPGETVIYLPLVLLRKAKSRFSIETFMHAAAVVMGDDMPDDHEVVKRSEDRTVVSVTEYGLRVMFGAHKQHTIHRVRSELVAEVDKDLPAWSDFAVEPAVRMSSSPKFPKGRFMSAKITILHPPVAELEARATDSATWLAPVRTSVPGWEKKPPRPRSHRAPARRLPPAPIESVAVLPDPVPPSVVRPRAGETTVNLSDEDVAF